MTRDLDHLEKLAKAATPGPWEINKAWNWRRDRTAVIAPEKCSVASTYHDDLDTGEANGAYVAAANPKTILALIDRIRKLSAVSEDANDGSPRAIDLIQWTGDEIK